MFKNNRENGEKKKVRIRKQVMGYKGLFTSWDSNKFLSNSGTVQ